MTNAPATDPIHGGSCRLATRPSALPISCALFLIACPALAQATELERALDYSVADGLTECPGEERLRQEVALRVGYDPFRAGAKEAVRVSLARRGNDLAATIEYRDEAGEVVDTREFTTPNTSCSCWAIVTSVAVAIAFTLTPFQLPEPPPPPCPAQPPPPPAPPAAPGPPAASPPAQEPPSPFVQVGGAAQLGLVSRPAVGGLAFVRLRWRAASLAAEASVIAQENGQGERGTPVSVALYAGALVPCVHQGIFSACGVAEVGLLRLHAHQGGDTQSALLGVGLRGALEIPLAERLLLRAHADLIGNVAPVVLRLDRREGWRSPTFSAFVGAGLALSFE